MLTALQMTIIGVVMIFLLATYFAALLGRNYVRKPEDKGALKLWVGGSFIVSVAMIPEVGMAFSLAAATGILVGGAIALFFPKSSAIDSR